MAAMSPDRLAMDHDRVTAVDDDVARLGAAGVMLWMARSVAGAGVGSGGRNR